MKRWRTLLLITLFSILASCGGKKENTINQRDEQGRKHGPWVEHYQNGKTAAEVRYVHGQKEGKETTYFPDGSPNIVRMWKADSSGSMLHGPYLHFYNNGNPLLRKSYINGVPNDTFTQFYRSGIKAYTGQYDTGMTMGTWKYYDEKGRLQVKVNYDQYQRSFDEALRSGTHTWYDTTGQPVYRGTWYKGQVTKDTILDEARFEELKSSDRMDLGRQKL